MPQTRDITAGKKDGPRIASDRRGLGISASAPPTHWRNCRRRSRSRLAPYGAELEASGRSRRARRSHEVLLQVPMEPFDYPDNDPGPQTLLTSLSGDQNVDRLHWLMSRFQGYVGVLSYMGAQFTASEAALPGAARDRETRADLCRRRRLAAQHRRPDCRQPNLPFAKADIVTRHGADADRGRSRAGAARTGGARARSAVGFARALPATVARIANWAKQVEASGFVLVPITMVAVKAKSS